MIVKRVLSMSSDNINQVTDNRESRTLYNEHMDIEYDLIYLREREKYYLNKSQAIDMVTSWIIKNSGQRYF